jgi:lipopolysaccharide export system permease protein
MILQRYTLYTFLLWLSVLLVGIGTVAYLIDMAELIRRANDEQVPLLTLILMGMCKLPALLEKIIPFVLLVAALLTLQRLSRRYELTSMRGAGMSIAQIMAPMLLVAVLVGVGQLLLFNPLSSALLGRYEQLENRYFREGTDTLAVSKGGIWLRQQDATGYSLLHAARASSRANTLQDVFVLRFSPDGTFTYRFDAKEALLQPGTWILKAGWQSVPGEKPRPMPLYHLATDFTLERLQDSFASPSTLSFWTLPAFIRTLEAAGFPARRHKLHWQTQLASPFLYAALVLTAA